MRVLDAVIKAMKNLGGEASLNDLYKEVNKYRPTPEHSIRGRLYEHSSDCDIYKSTSEDIFQSSEGKGKGIWRFRDKSNISADTWTDQIFNEENFSVGETFSTKEKIRLKSKLTPMNGTREPWPGYASLANAVLLFVNLYKDDVEEKYQFNDYFDGADFFWESQNNNTIETPYINKILSGTNTFLFCRVHRKDDWVYCGRLEALNYEALTNPMQFQYEVVDFQNSPSNALKEIYDWKPSTKTIIPYLSTVHKKVRKTSRGRKTDVKKNNAVELHAMEKAYEYYSDKNYQVIDVSDKRGLGYDYRCINGDKILEVEVKGRQNSGEKITLTKNEVENPKKSKNTTVLFIVHDIVLSLDNDDYQILSSKQRVIEGWVPDDKDLIASEYDYNVPKR